MFEKIIEWIMSLFKKRCYIEAVTKQGGKVKVKSNQAYVSRRQAKKKKKNRRRRQLRKTTKKIQRRKK